MNNIASYLKTILVTLGGAAIGGAAQYLQNGGAPTDYKSLGTAAASGAIVAATALFIKPPAPTPPPVVTPVPPVPTTPATKP